MVNEDTAEMHRRRWRAFAERLRHEMDGLGLTLDTDYWLQNPYGLDPNNVVELKEIERLTPEMLLALDKVVCNEPDWSLIVATLDHSSKKLRPLVQTNGGMFTLLSGGPAVREIIREAISRRGDDWLKYIL